MGRRGSGFGLLGAFGGCLVSWGNDREAQVMNDLWLAWSHQRLGRPLPQAVRERAAEEPRGAWPRPALALLAGDVTAEEMLKLIERKSGDERTMALAEGYFYLAQYY